MQNHIEKSPQYTDFHSFYNKLTSCENDEAQN